MRDTIRLAVFTFVLVSLVTVHLIAAGIGQAVAFYPNQSEASYGVTVFAKSAATMAQADDMLYAWDSVEAQDQPVQPPMATTNDDGLVVVDTGAIVASAPPTTFNVVDDINAICDQ